MKFSIILFFVILLCTYVACWNNDELEIFDLVEEINQNFYELMGIKQDASSQEIKRAYRNLSIILHPDKNDAEDANIKFRNLVSVYEVLKDQSKREKYDKVLRDGLPNWKSALYYYRRVRKMGVAEMLAILFVIITIGQYFVAWAVYAEKKYTAEQIFGNKLKKLQKKNRSNVDMDTILSEIPRPSVFNTLPFQIPKAIWYTPSFILAAFTTLSEIKEQELEKRRREAEELEMQKQLEEELAREKEVKKEKKETMRKRKQASVAPEKTEEELAGFSRLKFKQFSKEDAIRPAAASTKASLSGGFWTDEDLLELIRLVKKYPSGITNRWDVIADSMNRSIPEVTFMAAKLKENGYRIPGHTDSIAETIAQDAATFVQKKLKSKKTAPIVLMPETSWSQDQQQALETAIVKYPKSSSADRWQKIANNVPGKTKEECLIRYKYLVELLKTQKENKMRSEELEEKENSSAEANNIDEVNDRLEVIQNDSENLVEDVHSDVAEPEDDDAVEPVVKSKGKPRNKRKERKKRMAFSSDEDDDESS